MNSITLAVEILAVVNEKVGDTSTPMLVINGKYKQGYGEKMVEQPVKLVVYNGLVNEMQSLVSSDCIVVTGAIQVDKVSNPEGNRNQLSIRVQSFSKISDFVKVNSLSIIGRCGSDPEYKVFESATSVAKASLAVRRTKEVTDWLDCEAWGNNSNLMADYVHKGDQIGITGELQRQTWVKDGIENSKYILKGDRITLLGSKSNGNNNPRVTTTNDDADF